MSSWAGKMQKSVFSCHCRKQFEHDLVGACLLQWDRRDLNATHQLGSLFLGQHKNRLIFPNNGVGRLENVILARAQA